MKCFWCLVAYQNREREDVADGLYVYQGQSCCLRHVNEVRGLPFPFGRHPESGPDA